jgi:hypothetical protein
MIKKEKSKNNIKTNQRGGNDKKPKRKKTNIKPLSEVAMIITKRKNIQNF